MDDTERAPLKTIMLNLLINLALCQSLILVIVLLGRYRQLPMARYGIALLLSTAGYLYIHHGYRQDLHVDHPWLVYLDVPLHFLIPPLLYFYLRTSLRHRPIKLSRAVWHFIPALATLIFVLWLLDGMNDFQRIQAWDRPQYATISKLRIVYALIDLAYLCYFIAQFRELWRYKDKLLQFDSGPLLQRCYWLIGLFISAVSTFTIGSLVGYLDVPYWYISYFIDGVISLTILVAGIWVVWSPGVFLPDTEPDDDTTPTQQIKYQRNALTDDEQSRGGEQLKRWMEQQRPYLSPTLTLPELAEQLAFTTHQTSQLINQGFNENFHHFINRYRVTEVKQLLRNPSNAEASILQLAYQAGFSSKSSFNHFFKKLTGVTPSQYRSGPPSPEL